jgi:superfamily II DNA helicase RecQ
MVSEEVLLRGLRKYYGYTEFREGQFEVIQKFFMVKTFRRLMVFFTRKLENKSA